MRDSVPYRWEHLGVEHKGIVGSIPEGSWRRIKAGCGCEAALLLDVVVL